MTEVKKRNHLREALAIYDGAEIKVERQHVVDVVAKLLSLSEAMEKMSIEIRRLKLWRLVEDAKAKKTAAKSQTVVPDGSATIPEVVR